HPKEMDYIPNISLFKLLLLLIRNKGQDDIQKFIIESDPDKIGLVKIWAQQRKLASLAFHRALNPKMTGECTNEFITLLSKKTDTPMD
ncbi:1589_t:CDS:2, partial [Racocetra fulgida]